MKRYRTPQEKKSLSLKKDRRNRYGESVHGARKSIPRNKRFVNQEFRRTSNQAIKSGIESSYEMIDDLLNNVKRKKWIKAPDVPLGEVINAKKERRIRDIGAKKLRKLKQKERDEELIKKISEILKIDKYKDENPEKIYNVALTEMIEETKSKLRKLGKL